MTKIIKGLNKFGTIYIMHKHALMINNKNNLAAVHGKNRIFKN